MSSAASSRSNVPWCRSNAAPPAGRTPSRASAPGTVSRYQAKSSPPMLCSVSTSASAPERRDYGGSLQVDRADRVQHRRDAARVQRLGRHAARGDDLVDERGDHRPGRVPGVAAQHPQRAAQPAGRGDRVGRPARLDRAPHQRQRGARIDPARQQPGQVGDQPAQRVDEILGQMRTGRVTAGAGQPDLDVVAGRGDRPDPHTDLPGRQPRVAVQREDQLDVVDDAGRHRRVRATGHRLLGRLEDQPHPPGRRVRRRAAPPPPAGSRCAHRGRSRGRHPRRSTGREPPSHRRAAVRRCRRATR